MLLKQLVYSYYMLEDATVFIVFQPICRNEYMVDRGAFGQ